jgi:hypothetical protein
MCLAKIDTTPESFDIGYHFFNEESSGIYTHLAAPVFSYDDHYDVGYEYQSREIKPSGITGYEIGFHVFKSLDDAKASWLNHGEYRARKLYRVRVRECLASGEEVLRPPYNEDSRMAVVGVFKYMTLIEEIPL